MSNKSFDETLTEATNTELAQARLRQLFATYHLTRRRLPSQPPLESHPPSPGPKRED